MSAHDIDRTLAAWFEADGLAPAPTRALDQALEGVRRRQPRPAWLARPGSQWDWPTSDATPRDGVGVLPRWSTALIVATVLGLALVGAIAVGARLQESPLLVTPRLGQLAYAVDGDIFVADWDGANPVRIADGLPGGKSGCGPAGYWAEGPMWSPDGRFLAYRSARDQDVCDRPEADTFPTILISDPAGSVVAEVPGVGWLIPWSPDSTRFATWLDLYPSTRIGIYGTDGTRQAVLSLPRFLFGTTNGDHDPVWSPDGASILVRTGRSSTRICAGEPRICGDIHDTWEVPIDGRPPRQLDRDDPAAQWLGAHWPYGRNIAYVDPAGMHQHSTGPIAVSTLGDRVALVGPGEGLRVADVASGTITTLVPDHGRSDLSVIAFSPEGDRILFSDSDIETATRSIWSVDVDGSNLRPLVSRAVNHGSLDGDWQTVTEAPG